MLSIDYQNYPIQKIKVVNKTGTVQLIKQEKQKLSTVNQLTALSHDSSLPLIGHGKEVNELSKAKDTGHTQCKYFPDHGSLTYAKASLLNQNKVGCGRRLLSCTFLCGFDVSNDQVEEL
jgi:hypothetical protein